MPTELNRIKELAGLQQEATAISPNQIEAFKKWYDTYSKMQSKDVYNYAKGIFKAYMETGVTNLDGASKQDPKGKAYDDLAKIFPGMDGDIEAIGHQLKSQGVDPLDMEAEEDEDNARLKLKAMAGQESTGEAPATESLPAPSSDEEHAEMLFKTHPEYSKKYKTVQNFMRSQDFRDHMDHLSYKAQEASAAQPVNSSVDDTIQRARAQIETLEAALKEDYKKFQGMKPYKPKKK